MRPVARTLSRFLFPLIAVALAACGGGGSSSGSVSLGSTEATIGTASVSEASAPAGEQMMSYAEDIAPILQARCTGCHNSGDNPLAPFSLEGEDRANSFKSAIHFTLDNGTMPPAGFPQLSAMEKAKLTAWIMNEPLALSEQLVRIGLIEAKAWDIQPKNRDSFVNFRPDNVDCPRGSGWLVEEDELEVRTEFCNYLSLSQQSLLDLDAGTEVELAMSHSALNYNAPAEAHLAVAIAGTPVWERKIPIPSAGNIIKETLQLPFAVRRGDSIEVHLRNHGDNAYTIHSLDAFLPEGQELAYCPTFDSTFEAIQATVFEQAGCANSLCHSAEQAAGGLDLSPDVAWQNLVGVQAQGSSLLQVDPRKPARSYLYHKLSAKTLPGSYDISGAPMPSAGSAITPGQLEALRLWIEAGAPRTGSVGDTLGRGEDEIERLLGVCLPEAEALNTIPLPPPAPNKGVQFAMPPHDVDAESEKEICFAVYEDFRDQIPEEYLTPDGNYFYARGSETREDAFTHHNLIYLSPVGVDRIHDPAFGEWTCTGGERDGELCEPTDKAFCGDESYCRAKVGGNIACRGYGPRGPDQSGVLGLGVGIEREGFYTPFPAHGIFYWNSHAFNLTNEDGIHHVWKNFYFADDRRFRANGLNVTRYITSGAGTPPFEKKTVCRDYNFDQGDGLLRLSSHTHKRGERFFMSVNDELVYETFDYDEPLNKIFEPPMVFNSANPEERVLEWCATWNNGVNADGSPNIETVTRLSRRPENGFRCNPVACVAGKIGASCNGADDDASCDSAPGAGDGWCDACAIMPGVSSDDEMFILLGAKLSDYDEQLRTKLPPGPEVSFAVPAAGATFSPGDTVRMRFDFERFQLLPPEDHNHGDGGHDDGHGDSMHPDDGGNHSSVNAGHYHVYLDTEDDDADHLTAWTETAEFELPADLAPGEHTLRISLRAPDHHAVGVEDRVTITVQ